MYDCQCMILKEINIIFAFVIICFPTTSPLYPPEGEETSITVYKFKNTFCEKELLLIENLRKKILSCFKHQSAAALLSYGSFLH